MKNDLMRAVSRKRRSRLAPLWGGMIFSALVFLVLSSGSEISSSSEVSSQPVKLPAGEPTSSTSAPLANRTIPNESTLDDIQRQREALETRKKELDVLDAELKGRAAAVDEQVKRLDQLREELNKTTASKLVENAEKVSRLVETFEKMSPKSAAPLIAGLEENLAVAVIAQISTDKLAKIMSAMDPQRSGRLTEKFAGVVRPRLNSALSERGGEKNVGQNTNGTTASARSPGGAHASGRTGQ